jgi:transposase
MQLGLPQVLAAVERLPGSKGSPTFSSKILFAFFTCVLTHYYIRISAVQPESLVLQKNLQGAWPIADHFLSRLRLTRLLSEHGHCAPYANALQVLVVSVLLQPMALYRVAEWAQTFDPRWRPSPSPNDDVLGRALDRLFKTDRSALLTALVVQAVRAFGLQSEQIHNDSTSVKFSGAYAHQNPKGLQLRRGYSKDHRPDLKQLVYCLSVTADGSVPVHFKAYAGNQNDDPTHWESWQCLGRLLGHTDFLYVADCKLCVSDTMLKIDQQKGRFITILPRSRCEISAFAQSAAQCLVRWQHLWRRPATRTRKRPEIFEVATALYQIREGFRLYWYRSSEKQRNDAQARQECIAKAMERLKQLNQRRGRGPKTQAAMERAGHNILAHYHASQFIQFEIGLQERVEFVQTRRGRSSADSTYKKVIQAIPVLSAREDAEAIARAQTMDGTFPLVTNTELTALEVLQKYKYQAHLEKRHFLNKSVLEISPVFLKKNTRVEALMFIYFIAQMVAALIERAVRQNMTREGIKVLPILPEGRESKTPSYAQILETFAPCAKHHLYEKQTLVKTFTEPLTKLQQTLLRLLEIDPAVYQ